MHHLRKIKLTNYVKGFASGPPSARGPAGRKGSDQLVGAAFVLWKDAIERWGLKGKLEKRAHALAEPDGVAKLTRVMRDVLREAEPQADYVLTGQRRRNWNVVKEVSFEILPKEVNNDERLTLTHFAAVAKRIRTTRPHDNNSPRTVDGVCELFCLFWRWPPGMPNQQEESVEPEIDSQSRKAIDILKEVAPEATATLTKSMTESVREAIKCLAEPDQVVLSHCFQSFLLTRAAKRAYPSIDAEAIKSRDQTAAALGITRAELDRECERMDDWFYELTGQITRELEHRVRSAKGDE